MESLEENVVMDTSSLLSNVKSDGDRVVVIGEVVAIMAGCGVGMKLGTEVVGGMFVVALVGVVGIGVF